MSFSICLMISHRLPAHWPKRPRRRRKSSTVRRQHSPLTWPQALPAPPKWWVSSMTKHERMLRVVCHLFSWKLWSHNLQFSATRFPAYPADVNRCPRVQFSAPDHRFATHLYSEQSEVWHQVCGPFLHRSAIRLQWAVQQRGTSQRHLRHQTQRSRAVHGHVWHEQRYHLTNTRTSAQHGKTVYFLIKDDLLVDVTVVFVMPNCLSCLIL